jgi:fibronectin type 3 domain-containing protein/regulation of enolase protein 1 (concanavalin A-like superfamily)
MAFLALFLGASSDGAATTPAPPSFASQYQLVFNQDFTTMTTLSQLGVSSLSIGNGTWIAHTPTSQDFFTFENPSANYKPFGVGSGYLDIRVQKDGNDPNNYFGGYSGGLLSSMDGNGAGFAQQYGYFECSMWTPGSPNTWPAFWLLSAPILTNSSLPYKAEIDITESYGNYLTGPNQTPPGNPNEDSVAWHNYGLAGGTTSSVGVFVSEPGMTSGYHTYGVDVEPTGISWYFDRQLVWQAPIFDAAQQPLYILLDLALGGANFNNSTGTAYNWTLTPNPTDLKIQYVAVWASPNSPNYTMSAAPATPADLAATAGIGSVALQWSASSRATGYNVYRGTSSGSETILASAITATSYTDTAAVNGTTYYYVVTGTNGSGISGNSLEVSATPSVTSPQALPSPWLNTDIGSPGATGSSTYSGSTFTLNGAGSGAYYPPDAFQFAYQEVTGDCSIIARVATQANSSIYAHAGVIIRDSLANNAGFADMTFYPNGGGALFQYRPDGGSASTVSGTGTAPYWVKLTRSGNTFTGFASPNGTTWTQIGTTTLSMSAAVYIGLMQASGSNGALATSTFDNVSIAGTSVSIVPPTPTGLTAVAGNSEVTLQWNASLNATNYRVYRGTSSGGEVILAQTVTATSYYDPSPTNGVTYYYKVAAVNSSSTSSASNEVSATPSAVIAIPATPTSLTATAGSTTVTLQWNTSAGAANYNVYRSTSSGSESVLVVGVNSTSYTDYSVSSGTTYYYVVAAADSAGVSGKSNEVSATPTGSGITIPSAPTGLSAVGGSATVALQWSSSSSATSYNIYRGASSGSETILASGITASSYTDSTVTNGDTYYYVVTATNSAGTSGNSNEVSVTPASVVSSTLPSPWLNADVGSPGATGSSAYSSGTFTLNGAGGGAYYVPDAFQFAYQVVSGDCSIIARVATQANSSPYAHAGVIIRDSLANNAGFADVTLYPNGGGSLFQYRPDGGSASTFSGTGTAPYWVKLTRSGTTFTGFVSSNGTTWTQLGSTTLTMSATVYIGLLQASATGSLATSTFDNVTIGGAASNAAPAAPTGLTATGGNSQVTLQWTASSGATSYNVYRGASSGGETLLVSGVTTASYSDLSVTNGTTYYYEVTAVNSVGSSADSNEANATPAAGTTGTLPSPWLNQDVGLTYATGSSTYSGSTFTLMGAGNGAYYVPDAFQFAYQMVSGDCSIVARVVTQANSNPYAHAGVIIRDSLANNAGFADVTLYPNGGGSLFQYRADGGSPSTVSGPGTAPYWVKLTRSGSTFTGFVSPDGNSWTTFGSTTLTMPSTVYIGLLQASGIGGTISTATFDNVSVASGTTASAPAAPTGLSATAGNAQIVLTWSASSGATSYNVLRGTSSGAETALTTGIVATTHTDTTALNGTTYYYEVVAVSGTLTSGNSNEASATPTTGVTIPAAPAGVSATAGNAQIVLTWSASTGATTYNVLRGASSGGETLLTSGVASTSYTDSAVTNGITYFYEVAAVNSVGTSGSSAEVSAAPTAATGALPSPWLSQDIGATLATGSSSYSAGVFTLNGAGSGAYYTPDRFQFAYQAVSGDCSIVARVATQANLNPYAHAGVIIRDALTATAGFVDVTLYPNGGGSLFQYRSDSGNPATVSGGGTAPYWVKLTRSGNTFTGSVSSNGTTWTTLGSTTVTMPSTVYIGLLQASGINGTLATSTFDNVTLVP